MKTVKIRGVEIGAGIPKICVPIVGTAKKEILEQAAALRTVPADMAEWRIDWFENVYDFEALSDVLKELRAVLGDLPLLMTFRTSGEGGEKAIAPEAYAELNIRAARTGLIDLVDVELFTGGGIDPEDVGRASENGPGQAYTAQSAGNGIVRRIIREAHAANVSPDAGSGCGHSEGSGHAPLQKGRPYSACGYRGNGIRLRGPAGRHDVHGRCRCDLPPVR